jgi:hypothetical protein
MIRIPHVFISKLFLTHKNHNVKRLIVAHPRSVQYVQHDPDNAELCIRYVTGEQMVIKDKQDPANINKLFDDLVFQIKDTSDS